MTDFELYKNSSEAPMNKKELFKRNLQSYRNDMFN